MAAGRSNRAAAHAKAPGGQVAVADTGCGFGVVSRAHAKALKRCMRKAINPIQFATANGSTDAEGVLELFIDEFVQQIEPFTLGSTPDVISVGVKCMKHGGELCLF